MFFKRKNHQPTDPFLKRLRSLVIGEGMLADGNICQIEFVIKNLPASGSVLEIGSYGGLSTNLIIYFLKKYNKDNLFFNCDPWTYEGFDDINGSQITTIDGRADISRETYGEYMMNAFLSGIHFLSSDRIPHSFRLRSDDFFQRWNRQTEDVDLFGRSVKLGGKFGFIYIDGDHSESAVASDWTNSSQLLVSGGYVLFDDSADHLPFGSAKIISSIRRDNRFRFISKEPNYLFQKVAE